MYDLSSPRTRAYYAAMYEAEQAERDYSSAYRRMAWAGALAGSPEDYAVFSAGGYADSAHRVVRDMPVMERGAQR